MRSIAEDKLASNVCCAISNDFGIFFSSSWLLSSLSSLDFDENFWFIYCLIESKILFVSRLIFSVYSWISCSTLSRVKLSTLLENLLKILSRLVIFVSNSVKDSFTDSWVAFGNLAKSALKTCTISFNGATIPSLLLSK